MGDLGRRPVAPAGGRTRLVGRAIRGLAGRTMDLNIGYGLDPEMPWASTSSAARWTAHTCLTMSRSRVRESRTHGSIGGPLTEPETRTTSRLPRRVPLSGPPTRPTWQSVRRGSQLGAGRCRRSRSGRAWSMVGRALGLGCGGRRRGRVRDQADSGSGAGPVVVPVPEEKAGKNRLHPDFRPVDQTAEVKRLLCSARRRRVGQPSSIRNAEAWSYETVGAPAA